ncbi:MAG: DOPA 4,5-dioxygenase family protein [Gammaproteobacteria bacterium]|nr:DOPA 4,5-dioxygenase family protein [Gammaproteobacteria bacterium]
MPNSTDTIRGYHAHVYFDAMTLELARRICEQARDRFSIAMGRMHEKPVGPHPMWSCQLTVPADRFGEVVPWLLINREGLTVLVHPETGDALRDHTEHAMWLGDSQTLSVEMFKA